MSKRTVRCVIACVNASGCGEFVPLKVTCSEEDYDLGRHYEAAYAWAENQSYESPIIVIDEVEMQPSTVLSAFDWDIVPIIGADYTTPQ